MDIPVNAFKQAITKGERQVGLWSHLAGNISTEVISQSGFDWIVLDMEHGPNEIPTIITQLQAMKGGTATPVARPPWNDTVVIKRLLDTGCQTLLIPYVQTREEAEAAVAATRYPLAGIRGVAGGTRASAYGRRKEYLTRASEEICLLVQVETAEALERIEEIASVDGVDGVFIGPSDLSASMGFIGRRDADEVHEAIAGAAKRLAAVGKASGILGTSLPEADRFVDYGYVFVAVGSDTGVLARGADELAARFKGK
jgi:4-hydroxy-2-oxoheptanedioate aldolase